MVIDLHWADIKWVSQRWYKNPRIIQWEFYQVRFKGGDILNTFARSTLLMALYIDLMYFSFGILRDCYEWSHISADAEGNLLGEN